MASKSRRPKRRVRTRRSSRPRPKTRTIVKTRTRYRTRKPARRASRRSLRRNPRSMLGGPTAKAAAWALGGAALGAALNSSGWLSEYRARLPGGERIEDGTLGAAIVLLVAKFLLRGSMRKNAVALGIGMLAPQAINMLSQGASVNRLTGTAPRQISAAPRAARAPRNQAAGYRQRADYMGT